MIKYEIFFLKKGDNSKTLFSLSKYNKDESGSSILVPTENLSFIDKIGVRRISDDGSINYAIFTKEFIADEGTSHYKEVKFSLKFNSESGHLLEILSQNIIDWGEYQDNTKVSIEYSGNYKDSLQFSIEDNTLILKSSTEEFTSQEEGLSIFNSKGIFKPKPSAVNFSITTGIYFKGQRLILNRLGGNPIFFVKGENTELTFDSKNLYTSPIILNESCTIKAAVYSFKHKVWGPIVQQTFTIIEKSKTDDTDLGDKRAEYLKPSEQNTFSAEIDFERKKYNSIYTPTKVGVFKYNKNWKKKNEVAQKVIENLPGEIIYSNFQVEIYLSKSITVQDFVNCLDLSKLKTYFYGGEMYSWMYGSYLETQTNKNTLLEIKNNFNNEEEFPLYFYFRNLWNPTLEYDNQNSSEWNWDGQITKPIGRVNLKSQNILLLAEKEFLSIRDNFNIEFFDKGYINYEKSNINWGDTFAEDESLGNVLTKSPYLTIQTIEESPQDNKKITDYSHFKDLFDNGLEGVENPAQTINPDYVVGSGLPLKYWKMKWSISTPIFKNKIFTDSYFKLVLEKRDRFGNTIQNLYKIPLKLNFHNSLIQIFFINASDGNLSHFYSMDAMENDGHYYTVTGAGTNTKVISHFQVWCPNINNLSIKSTQTKNCYRENTNWGDKKHSFPKIIKLDDQFGLLEHTFVIKNNKIGDSLEFTHTLEYSEGENYDKFTFREIIQLV